MAKHEKIATTDITTTKITQDNLHFLHTQLLSLLHSTSSIFSVSDVAQHLARDEAALRSELTALQSLGVEALLDGQHCQPKNCDLIRTDSTDRLHPAIQHLHLFASLDSTNAYLLQHRPEDTHAHVVVAEHQTAGRGRRGRKWQAAYAHSLCFSLGWMLPHAFAFRPIISLLPALVVADVLNDEGWPVRVKWPNDILLNGKKLGGILIEARVVQRQGQTLQHLVIGIGLNIYDNASMHESIDQAWTSLENAQLDQTGTRDAKPALSRTDLFVRILNQLVEALSGLTEEAISALHSRWQNYDAYQNQAVVIKGDQQSWQGIARGIDQQGALILETPGGRETFMVGDVSLRDAASLAK